MWLKDINYNMNDILKESQESTFVHFLLKNITVYTKIISCIISSISLILYSNENINKTFF